MVSVSYFGQEVQDKVIITREGTQPLLGRSWLSRIQLDWARLFPKVHKVTDNHHDLVRDYPTVFEAGLGHIKDRTASIQLKDGAVPRCLRPRPLPYALRNQVELELDRLQAEGIIVPVEQAEWAAPIVVVPKKNGSIRLCADFKVTINPFVVADPYPIPNPTDLFAALAGCKVFSKLDLSQAYAQLPLDDESRRYCVISTHKGLFAYTRLPFGVSSAPGIFQRTIEQIVQGIPGVGPYYDDLLIGGADELEQAKRARAVLDRFAQQGVRLQGEKCEFFKTDVTFLGYRISQNGLNPTNDKVAAIQNAPAPTDVSSLKSFLGLVTFYRKFIPDASTLLHPLHELTKSGVEWRWSKECEEVFDKVKTILSAEPVLAHYDIHVPLVLQCDASPHGVGACLFHKMSDSSLQPVHYVSRALTAAEVNYSQLDREALAIVFAVKKLHQYLYGRHFVLQTDHQPLVRILGEHEGIPTVAAARLQRWALTLGAYNYTIGYIPGKENVSADCLSRLPLALTSSERESIVNAIDNFLPDPCSSLPVDSTDIAAASKSDTALSQVCHWVQHGWPSSVPESYRPYFNRRDDLSVVQGCLMWGNRVIIPQLHQAQLLKELHDGHLGTSRMKGVARSFFWWPRMDSEIEAIKCQICEQTSRRPTSNNTHVWVYPSSAMERVHIDFAEFDGKQFLLAVDAYSKWVEVYPLGTTATTSQTIEKLRIFVSTFGLMKIIVSDNGPQFRSDEFMHFCKENGIEHKFTPPYHPATNGQVERIVQEFKKFVKRAPPKLSVNSRVSQFLLVYRNTPHTFTNRTPASLMLRQTPRTRFSLLMPGESIASDMRSQQPSPSSPRSLLVGDNVLILNGRPSTGPKWLPGKVVQKLGPVSYLIESRKGRRHVHIDHLRHASTPVPEMTTGDVPVAPPSVLTPQSRGPQEATSADDGAAPPEVSSPALPVPELPELRRSTRSGVSPRRLIEEM